VTMKLSISVSGGGGVVRDDDGSRCSSFLCLYCLYVIIDLMDQHKNTILLVFFFLFHGCIRSKI